MVPPRKGNNFFEGRAVAVADVGGADAGAERFDGANEEGLDHGDVADDDRDECFADGPAAGLLSTIGTSLARILEGRLWDFNRMNEEVKSDMVNEGEGDGEGEGERGLTVRMRTQRRMPAIVTNIPPLNMMRRSAFFFRGI